jgi:hypothetical protein
MVVWKSLLDESALSITCPSVGLVVVILSCTLPPSTELLDFGTEVPALLVESRN